VIQLATGALFALVIALLASRAHALDRSGAFGAFVVGTIVFGIGGWKAAIVLLAFFIPSTILSRVGAQKKRRLTDIGKHGPRDAWQVLANGGIAALAMLLEPRYGGAALAAFAGAFAAASSDTWGTEIGTLARGAPRSILTLRPLATGLSGGITLQGTIAELAGAVFVALAAAVLGVAPFIAVVAGGIAGALFDSLLGASAQALRYCPACERACETNPHVCGSSTQLRRGFAWMENDAVNAAATLCGAVVALAVFLL
jgi:uncharacterized protein (TIGR00297 family)